jgi:hypothetical protein
VFLIDPANNRARNTDAIPAFEGYAGINATVGDDRIWANGGSSGMNLGSSAVQVVDPASGHLVTVIDAFHLTMGGCSMAVAGGSLWETCSGVRTDSRGRVLATIPPDASYVVRVREP